MEIINREIADYTESFTSPETPLLKELVQLSEEELKYTDMLSGPQVGMLLKILIQLSSAKRVLEIGTFTGYSAIWMADALPENGKIITLEMNERYRDISKKFFEREPYSNKITQKMGNAIQLIPTLEGRFDLIFLDADKNNYPDYYTLLKPILNVGGLLVVDNVLWEGTVLNPENEKAKAIHKLNELIDSDEVFEQVMLPVRDGITIARKIL